MFNCVCWIHWYTCYNNWHTVFIVFYTDCDGDLLNLALVHYTFDNEEHKILSRPHGNSKSHNPYIRTKPSTLHKLREVSQYLPPKHAVGEVSKSVGGVAGAYSIAELPRNRQQSSDCRRKLFLPSQSAPVADPLFPIMIMCKESEGVNSDPSLRFVRIVTNSPEPMAVLAFDWTLADLERFCSKPLNHTVLSVDPTFNLGSFHVTVTTYKHPMLEYKNKKGCHPVMLGPLFIHQRKAFSTYNFFFSQLIGLRPALCDLQCYGTDGEKALEEALCMQFRSGTHLRCFLHFRGNLESKLSDLGISKPDAQEFVKDVLGNPAQLEEGLVDADSDLLDEEFEVLRKKWNERESLLTKTTEPHFHDWFRVNCLSVVRNSMLKHKRIAAGLGSPPDPFYTNDVESKNRVLKHQTSYRAQQLPSFVQSMRRMYEDQKEEVERAVVGLGEYRLCSPYRDLGVNSKEWCKKNEKQRERILKRFQNAQLKSEFGSESPDFNSDSSVECAHDKQLPSSSNPLINTRLSESIQMSMWAKVQSYLGDSASYTNAPGVMDYSCLLVKSQSSTRPHFVQKTGSGAYKCDKECLMFKSTNGVCSHSLLAANLNGELDLFVNRYSKTKVPTNYANLAQHGLPVGGKKPSTRRKSSSKKTTAAVKNLIADADHVKRTKRTPVTTSTIPVTLTTEERLLTCAPVTSSTAGNSTVYAPYSSINSLSTNISVASPRPPPPLLHFSPGSSSVGQLFYIVFLNSRISRCQGCRGQIVQGLPSPHDIVIQHKEHVLFQNPNTGNWQLSKDLRNTYYHPRFGCISVKHPDFSSSELKISAEVRCKLLPSHFTLLNAEFGLWQF